jgi:hypothetical protein
MIQAFLAVLFGIPVLFKKEKLNSKWTIEYGNASEEESKPTSHNFKNWYINTFRHQICVMKILRKNVKCLSN